jgi:molybdate transport system substrate-binding protein
MGLSPVLNRVRAVLLALVCLGTAFAIPSTARAIEIACDPATPAASSPATPEPATPELVPFPADSGTLTVFAAASLVDAFAAIESDLEAANPGLDIVVETAGSQTLVTQLTEGAEADVLATASTSSMKKAEDAGVIAGDPVDFTGNRLVIVTPTDNPAGIASFDDLANDDLLLVIAGEDVPAGQYARRAICAGEPEFVGDVGDNVVSEEEDVRSVLAKVQVGEADAGIVYASDAVAVNLTDAGVNVIEFPDDIDTTAVYPIAPVVGGNEVLANAFISYILGADGQHTLTEYGFSTPG